MDHDPYAFLKPPSNSGLKKSASTRIDNLIQKGSASSAKINSLKIKQRANELKEMRSIPIINQKSRKIAEGMKRERLDIINSIQPKEEEKEKNIEPEPVRISVNIIKQLDQIEKSNPEPDLKSMSIADRSKYWKEQKEKKIEEQRKAKQDKELDGCTFKPKKNFETEAFDVINRPFSGRNAEDKKKTNEKQGNGVMVKDKNFSERSKTEKNSYVAEDNFALMLKGKDLGNAPTVQISKPVISNPSQLYQNLSPATQGIRMKPGFLSEMSKPKGK